MVKCVNVPKTLTLTGPYPTSKSGILLWLTPDDFTQGKTSWTEFLGGSNQSFFPVCLFEYGEKKKKWEGFFGL